MRTVSCSPARGGGQRRRRTAVPRHAAGGGPCPGVAPADDRPAAITPHVTSPAPTTTGWREDRCPVVSKRPLHSALQQRCHPACIGQQATPREESAPKFEGMTNMINGAFMEDLSELLNSATGDERRRRTFYEIDTKFEKMRSSLLKNIDSMQSLMPFLRASLRQTMIRARTRTVGRKPMSI